MENLKDINPEMYDFIVNDNAPYALIFVPLGTENGDSLEWFLKVDHDVAKLFTTKDIVPMIFEKLPDEDGMKVLRLRSHLSDGSEWQADTFVDMNNPYHVDAMKQQMNQKGVYVNIVTNDGYYYARKSIENNIVTILKVL